MPRVKAEKKTATATATATKGDFLENGYGDMIVSSSTNGNSGEEELAMDLPAVNKGAVKKAARGGGSKKAPAKDAEEVAEKAAPAAARAGKAGRGKKSAADKEEPVGVGVGVAVAVAVAAEKERKPATKGRGGTKRMAATAAAAAVKQEATADEENQAEEEEALPAKGRSKKAKKGAEPESPLQQEVKKEDNKKSKTTGRAQRKKEPSPAPEVPLPVKDKVPVAKGRTSKRSSGSAKNADEVVEEIAPAAKSKSRKEKAGTSKKVKATQAEEAQEVVEEEAPAKKLAPTASATRKRGKTAAKSTPVENFNDDDDDDKDQESANADKEPVGVPKKKAKKAETKVKPAVEKKKRGKAAAKVAEQPSEDDDIEDDKTLEELKASAQEPEPAPAAAAATAAAEKKSRTRKRAVAADENDEADGSKPSAPKKAAVNATNSTYVKEDFELPPGLDTSRSSVDCQGRFNLKISSWNVAGLRSWLKKDGLKFLEYEEPDIFCLQETKCTTEQLPEEATRISGYHPYWLCMPGGYAGVAIYSKIMPINVEYGIGNKEFDAVGRIITAEYEKFFLVNVYVPNSGRKLVNLEPRMRWEELFQQFVQKLDARKPLIICGDMNVSHQEIDLANPKTNTRNAGFTKEERDKMTELLKLGFVDTFRELYPDRKGAYTFWTYMGNARARNVGWRLDYFIVSERFNKRVVENCMRTQCMGSDHCPITMFLKV